MIRFERAHVVLVQPLARRQMPQRARAQVQAVEMARGHFASLLPRVMRGGLVPVAVGGEDLVSGQFGKVGQAIMEREVGSGEERAVDVAEHLASARALEGGEVVGVAGGIFKTSAMFLEKGASAFGEFEHALDAQTQAVLVRELVARPGVLAGGSQAAERLEKRGIHGGGRMRDRH